MSGARLSRVPALVALLGAVTALFAFGSLGAGYTYGGAEPVRAAVVSLATHAPSEQVERDQSLATEHDGTNYDDRSQPARAPVRLGGYRLAPNTAATGTDDLSRVGRWMSPDERSAMVRSGEVQVGGGGATRVASPANPESYMRQAPAGDYYVEFGVPTNSLFPAGRGDWAQIPGPGHRLSKLAAGRGNPIEHPVRACNIAHLATRISC